MSTASKRTDWTPAIDAWLRDKFPTTASKILASQLGVSVGALRQRARILGLYKTAEWRAQNARETTLERSLWAPELLEILDLMYADIHTQELADFLGLPVTRVHAMANARGLRKNPELLAQMARDRLTEGHGALRSQFQKGHRSWNTGRKGFSHPGSKATQFQKGARPHTWQPIGTYRINADSCLERKVNDLPGANHVRWHPVTRLVWQEAHGPIPENHLVVFKPGQKTKVLELITVDRLECITRAENARRNHPNSSNPELARLVQLKGAITRQVNRITREAQEISA